MNISYEMKVVPAPRSSLTENRLISNINVVMLTKSLLPRSKNLVSGLSSSASEKCLF